MSADAGRWRVLVLAPMPIELAPVVKRLGLEQTSPGTHTGRSGRAEVVAGLIGIGPEKATAATRRLVAEHDPDHVVVVGVAGGLAPTISVGDLIVPAVIGDLADDSEHLASPLGAIVPQGRLVTSSTLIVDRGVIDGIVGSGADAIDMETSAVAAVCAATGTPWTAIRGISDHVAEGLLDEGTTGLLRDDGRPDLAAVARYVTRRPGNAARLFRLARGSRAATGVATSALLDALRAGPAPPPA